MRRASVVQDQAGQVDGGARVDVQVAAAEDHRAGLCPWAFREMAVKHTYSGYILQCLERWLLFFLYPMLNSLLNGAIYFAKNAT